MHKFTTYNAIEIYKDHPLVVWPLIGRPLFINLGDYSLRLKKYFYVKFLVLSTKLYNSDDVLGMLKEKLFVYPLLGLEKGRGQARRGYMQEVEIVGIKEKPFLTRENMQALIESYLGASVTGEKIEKEEEKDETLTVEPLSSLLIEHKIFSPRERCYELKARIKITDEIREYLREHSFILFDTVQYFGGEIDTTRILYHNIALFKKKKWTDFTFIHISDLHISKRNDEFLGIISTNLRTSVFKSLVKVVNGTKKRIRTWATRTHREELAEAMKPLEERIINPNNMLRRFNIMANAMAQKGELDFVIMTGDLVDFCIRSDKISPLIDTNYENTNWVRFLDIILNRPLEPPHKGKYPLLGIEPNEELLVPFFTTPGNHDYRVGHYSIRSIGIYKHLGLKYHEALNFDEPPTIAPLLSSVKALYPYYQHINPYPNYAVKLGPHIFVFLDSGPDSFLEIRSLLMADPSLTGFSVEQMEYWYYICEIMDHITVPSFSASHKPINRPISGGMTEEEDVQNERYSTRFLLSHAPILNPIFKHRMQMKLFGTLKDLPKPSIELFKEHNLRKEGIEDTRSDLDLEYRAGTISNNWITAMGYIEDYFFFALNGHTHKWREFRTRRSNFPTICHTGYGKRMLNPFAIYWDDYTLLYGDTPEFFEKNSPFHFQTPALGIGSSSHGLKSGGYRIISIKKNRLARISMEFLGD